MLCHLCGMFSSILGDLKLIVLGPSVRSLRDLGCRRWGHGDGIILTAHEHNGGVFKLFEAKPLLRHHTMKSMEPRFTRFQTPSLCCFPKMFGSFMITRSRTLILTPNVSTLLLDSFHGLGYFLQPRNHIQNSFIHPLEILVIGLPPLSCQ